MSIDKLTMGLLGALQNFDISDRAGMVMLYDFTVSMVCDPYPDWVYFSIMVVKFVNSNQTFRLYGII